MKTISVIVPNYNNARFLQCAIESILSQTFQDYEIIVVDDGSTDNSREVVRAFGDKVRCIYQENKGLGGARNTAILASDAEFIGLLDADDEWRSNFLAEMMLLARRHPDAAVYYSAAQGMDSSGNDLPQIFGRLVSSDNFYESMLRANFIIPSTVIFRRFPIIKAGLFEEKNRALHGVEDWDLWLRLSPAHQFVGTVASLVRYRLHPNTFSANFAHMQQAVKTVVEKNFGLDDSRYESWSKEKRRAFGGVYRYQALTSVQKEDKWDVAAEYLLKAFEIDPTLTGDLDLFYELAFGTQPPGYRDSAYCLELEKNGSTIVNMLETVFMRTSCTDLKLLRKNALATAAYAIGLVGYNTNQRRLSKRFIFQALLNSPNLFLDQKIVLTLIKSHLPQPFIQWFKRQ